MKHRYDNWVKGLQWDWLISNQRYLGVAFPVWYCKKCSETILADESQLPVEPSKDKPKIKECPKCKCKEFIPEIDVLNTWFTSSMTPWIGIQLTDKETQKKLFPMDLRPQSHDIISFWLFNTVVKSNLHFNKNPWSDVMLSGFITLNGEKMSKSKGNTILPQEVMDKYGADAIRYWASSSKLGEDMDYQEKDVITGKKFITKILNATNFVFMNLKYQKEMPKLCEVDRIFLTRLNNLIKTSTEAFEDFNYSKAKLETDSFFFWAFADNYLEIIKNRVYNGTDEEKASAFYTLYQTLLVLLKLFAPFTPYITEEIYQTHFEKHEKNKSVHLESWPTQLKLKESKSDEEVWNKLLDVIKLVRQAKSEAKTSMKTEVSLTLPKADSTLLKPVLADLKSVANAKDIKEGEFKVSFS